MELKRKLTRAAGSILVLYALAASSVYSQIEWLKDASAATIPDGPVTGRINGKPAILKVGWVKKTGSLDFGAPDAVFDHYTVVLRDSDNFMEALFSVDMTLTVRKGERLDGKTFRAIQTRSVPDKPSIRGPGYSVPEFYSLRMESRRGKEFMSGTDLISQTNWLFSGRVEIGDRDDEKMSVRLYVCFADEMKSCIAGTVRIDLR